MKNFVSWKYIELRIMSATKRGFARFVFIFAILFLALSHTFAITVTMNAKVEDGDKPVVVGTTNLPDGIVLMFTISRKENQYIAQSKSKVEAGTFRSDKFSEKGAPLNPGVYTLEISMPVAVRQPASVLPVIGERGSKLQGVLVKTSDIPALGKYVEYKTSFTIGSGKSSAEKDKSSRAQSAKDKRAWKLQGCKDLCAMTKSSAEKRNELFDYDQCYKQCSTD